MDFAPLQWLCGARLNVRCVEAAINKDDEIGLHVKVATLEQQIKHLTTWIRIVALAAGSGSLPPILKLIMGAL
jgi:hypothetical protein